MSRQAWVSALIAAAVFYGVFALVLRVVLG